MTEATEQCATNKIEKLSTFPVFMKVESRKIVVVGNGEAALAKLRLLTQTNAQLVAIADNPIASLRYFLEQEQESNIIWLKKQFLASLLQDAVLVFSARASKHKNQEVIEAAQAKNIPVNVVDMPNLCDFYTPTLVNRAPVAIAIGSEGTGPVLTQLIRARIEAMLPQKLGKLARYAALWRDEVERCLSPGRARRWFWRRFFSPSLATCVEHNTLHHVRQDVINLIDAAKAESTGKIVFINSAAIALKQLQEILLLADHIIYDNSVAAFLVTQGRRDAHRHEAGEYATQNADLAVTLQRQEQMVVRLSHNEHLIRQEIAILNHHSFSYERIPSAVACIQKYSSMAA